MISAFARISAFGSWYSPYQIGPARIDFTRELAYQE
jgi:hypothetical protein